MSNPGFFNDQTKTIDELTVEFLDDFERGPERTPVTPDFSDQTRTIDEIVGDFVAPLERL